MKYARALAFAAVAGITIVTATGCSVAREQQTVGSLCVDDAGITAAVKAKMAEDKNVSATSISVETLNGTVQLSGFAKSQTEKNQAENIARNTKHVREVRNNIVIASLTGQGLRRLGLALTPDGVTPEAGSGHTRGLFFVGSSGAVSGEPALRSLSLPRPRGISSTPCGYSIATIAVIWCF